MFDVDLTSQQTTAIYAYFVPVVGLVFLLFLIRKNHLFSRRQSQLFNRAVLVNLLLIALTAADYLLSAQATDGAFIFRRFTSMAHFSVAPLLPFLLLQLYSRKKLRWYACIPIIISAVFCIISMFQKSVFFISEQNTYERGPLFFIPMVVTIFYIVLLMANPIIAHRQGKRQEAFYLCAIVAIFLFALWLEVGMHFKCMEYGASAIGLIMYYILQNIHFFSSDPLTGAYNRQMYNHMIENVHKSPSNIFALIDINNFKNINDEQGHDAGDKALILFVSILNQYFDNTALIYRIGGDEFMLVSLKPNMPSFLEALGKARKTAEENSLKFACGIVEHHKGENVEELLLKVDKEMYIAKSEMKKLDENVIAEQDYTI